MEQGRTMVASRIGRAMLTVGRGRGERVRRGGEATESEEEEAPERVRKGWNRRRHQDGWSVGVGD